MAEVPFRPVRQLSEYKGKGASASREDKTLPSDVFWFCFPSNNLESGKFCCGFINTQNRQSVVKTSYNFYFIISLSAKSMWYCV